MGKVNMTIVIIHIYERSTMNMIITSLWWWIDLEKLKPLKFQWSVLITPYSFRFASDILQIISVLQLLNLGNGKSNYKRSQKNFN